MLLLSLIDIVNIRLAHYTGFSRRDSLSRRFYWHYCSRLFAERDWLELRTLLIFDLVLKLVQIDSIHSLVVRP